MLRGKCLRSFLTKKIYMRPRKHEKIKRWRLRSQVHLLRLAGLQRTSLTKKAQRYRGPGRVGDTCAKERKKNDIRLTQWQIFAFHHGRVYLASAEKLRVKRQMRLRRVEMRESSQVLVMASIMEVWMVFMPPRLLGPMQYG